MSSLLTNASAMTALQTLSSINKNMSQVQSRISTGERVASASDNAAYWSISTTMRSDNNAMSTVKDALGLGAAQVDVAYTAMDAVKDTLDTMKSKLVAASQPDVDKTKIQAEIKQLQEDLKTYAESASFSGGNWLNVSEASTQKIVASFTRDSTGGISLGTIDINTIKTALFNDAKQPDGTNAGLLEETITVSPGAQVIEMTNQPISSFESDGVDPATATIKNFDDLTFEEDATLTFSLALNGSSSTTQFTVAADAVGVFDFNTALEDVFGTGVVTATIDGGGDLVFTGGGTLGDSLSLTKVSAATAATAGAKEVSVADFDISALNRNDIQSLVSHLDGVMSKVTNAASDLGAVKTRIDSQQSFVGKIMDAIDRGIGQLVDADMNAESARLSALQTQQQLGIQALSIANQSSQNILSLFR